MKPTLFRCVNGALLKRVNLFARKKQYCRRFCPRKNTFRPEGIAVNVYASIYIVLRRTLVPKMLKNSGAVT